MATAELISQFADEVLDADEESFELFARRDSSLSLGHLPTHGSSLRSGGNSHASITIPSLPGDLTITQSSTLLHSSLPGGTTGALVWRLQPLLAGWLLSPTNPLFSSLIAGNEPLLDAQSTLLELGTGIGGVLALALALSRRVARVVATDQPYVLRGLRANLAANLPRPDPDPGPTRGQARGKRSARSTPRAAPSPVDVMELDWENTDATSLGALARLPAGPDALLACDCVYNEALVSPLARACVEACGVRARWRDDERPDDEDGEPCSSSRTSRAEKRPTVCVIAQQLRAPEVFEAWLRAFLDPFRMWRVREEAVGEGMRVKDGFVVHVAILKRSCSNNRTSCCLV